MNNILILAPHADDEILGCGAAISKYVKNGNNVYIAIMTNAFVGDPELFSEEGIRQVRAEAIEAHDFLGVKKTFFFDFPAPKLDTYPSYKISNAISNVIHEYSIDTVFLPHRGDIHKDHKIIFEAGLVACRPISNSSVKRVLAYETLSETEWAAPFGDDAFIPNFYISVDEADIQVKLSAMSFFKSQLRSYPNSRSLEAIKSLAMFRGVTISKSFAEAFMLIRNIDVL